MGAEPAEEVSFDYLSQLGQQQRVRLFIALLRLRQPQRPPMFFDFSVQHFHEEEIARGVPLKYLLRSKVPF